MLFDPNTQVDGQAVEMTFCPRSVSRLLPFLGGDQAPLSLRYRVFSNESRLFLELESRGDLQVVCQRCLGSMGLSFNKTMVYELIDELSAPMEAEQEYEQVLIDENRVDITEVISDEILLCLPVKHEFDCSNDSSRVNEEEGPLMVRENPFSVLKDYYKVN